MHEEFTAFKNERREEDRRNSKGEKQFSKMSDFSARSNVQETKPPQSNQCPLVDGTHRIWSCESFKNIYIINRYVAVSKQRSCYGCVG